VASLSHWERQSEEWVLQHRREIDQLTKEIKVLSEKISQQENSLDSSNDTIQGLTKQNKFLQEQLKKTEDDKLLVTYKY
jgi:predicted  nucleic acid-binding Zn-ribbon protein